MRRAAVAYFQILFTRQSVDALGAMRDCPGVYSSPILDALLEAMMASPPSNIDIAKVSYIVWSWHAGQRCSTGIDVASGRQPGDRPASRSRSYGPRIAVERGISSIVSCAGCA